MLKCEVLIPPEYSPHILHGNYRGCMECHVGYLITDGVRKGAVIF
jgi:mRNA-degrading endonuclease YafQ of YafQ-DinJ toxin-antitoxin module